MLKKSLILLVAISQMSISLASEISDLPSKQNIYKKISESISNQLDKGFKTLETISGIQEQEFLYNKQTQMAISILEESSDNLGVPYKWGGENIKGFDCSGLVKYVFKNSLDIELPRTAREMSRVGQKIYKYKDLNHGDLVFFNTRNFKYSHVGIYIGDNKFLHAPRTGSQVRVDNITNYYWKSRFNGARRLIKENEQSSLIFDLN